MPDSQKTASMYLDVTPDHAGKRLDRWIADMAPELSRSRARALIDGGHVLLQGEPATEADTKVRDGQSFAIFIPDPEPATPKPEQIALDILFEDASVLVIDKLAGMVVHPAPGHHGGTLVNAVLAHCGDSLSGIGGVRRPGIVHRLDKDTSGLMVVAKTAQAHAALVEQFAARTVRRRYTALVWGAAVPPSGKIEGNIGRSRRNRKKMAVLRSGGREARTRYETIRRFGPDARPVASQVHCRLESGRTHQIRVHMTHIGHPVIGDPVYGGGLSSARRSSLKGGGLTAEALEAVNALGRQALDATELGFNHPETGQMLEFSKEIPIDMKALITCLEVLNAPEA